MQCFDIEQSIYVEGTIGMSLPILYISPVIPFHRLLYSVLDVPLPAFPHNPPKPRTPMHNYGSPYHRCVATRCYPPRAELDDLIDLAFFVLNLFGRFIGRTYLIRIRMGTTAYPPRS